MNKMITETKKLTSIIAVLIIMCAINHNALAKNEINDYLSTPPILLSGEDSIPNIMLVLDNSGSMRSRVTGPGCPNPNTSTTGHTCEGHQDSRSYIVRSALARVLDSLEGRANVGLMVYQSVTRHHPDSRGSLRAFIKPLDADHKDFIKTRIQTEDHVNENSLIIKSDQWTPIEGALLESRDYINGNMSESQNHTGVSPTQFIPPQQCTAETVVILLTDGQASSNTRQWKDGYDCTSSTAVCATEAAARLLSNEPDAPGGPARESIRTYVIGFGGIPQGINNIAVSGGTEAAYEASNEEALIDVFADIFGDIYKRNSSFSSGSVLSSSSAGFGTQIFPSFVAQKKDSIGNEVNWAGSLQSYFVDSKGYLRQNNDGMRSEPSLDEDHDIIFEFNQDNGELGYLDFGTQRTASENGTPRLLLDPDTGSLNLIPVWDASEQLNTVYNINAIGTANPLAYRQMVRTNRSYSSLPNNAGGRYIFTCIDSENYNPDAATKCDTNETKQFVWDNNNNNSSAITPNLRHYLLGADSPGVSSSNNDATENIIAFIRGDESLNSPLSYVIDSASNFVSPEYRKRTLNYGTADQKTYLLGDIVNSNALQVGPRNEYDDPDYKAYREQTTIKRNMVYVGANDGMLHAFNAGFFDPAYRGYKKNLNGETRFDLGEELWAYVPQAVLPHLRFLTKPDYNAGQHVYFVDGQMRAFDAKIFADDAVHINGWGTILVATTRFGGAAHDIDSDGNGVLNDNDKELRPSILVFDISNPEAEPVLLAEISHPNLKLTTSAPTLVREEKQDTDDDHDSDWFLMFGSGPTDLKHVTSEQTAQLFKYRLSSNVSNWGFVDSDGYSADGLPLGDITNDSFVGDLVAKDWNRDGFDDAVYYGTVTGTADQPSGDLRRVNLLAQNEDRHSVIVNTDEPTLLAPFLVQDSANNAWVISHSGRTLAPEDWNYQSSTWMYAIKERFRLVARGKRELSDVDYNSRTNGTTVHVARGLENDSASLINVTDIDVKQDGTLDVPSNAAAGLPTPTPLTFESLYELMQTSDDIGGWRRELTYPVSRANERFLQSPVRIPTIDGMFFTTYIPPSAACSIEPSGVTYALSFVTGTAYYDTSIVDPDDNDRDGLLGVIGSGLDPEAVVKPDNYGDYGDNNGYQGITRITANTSPLNDPEGPPCEYTIRLGTKGLDSGTATDEFNKECPPANRKSWVEIDLSNF